MTTATTVRTNPPRSLGVSVAFALWCLLPVACLSLAPRSQPVSVAGLAIEGVPARRWAENRCAAGALSEVLNYLGDPVTEERLSRSLTRGRGGGVITVDLLLAARNRGYDTQLVRGDVDLLARELEQQRPLILMLRVLDAPGTDDDRFHYVVLSGLDPEQRLVLVHFGDSRKRWVPIQAFQRPWAAGDYATLLIGPAEAPVATEADFRRAVMLEAAGNIQEAIALYRHFLHSHPQSALAWTNLGNAHAGSGEDHLAEVAYRNALFLEKDHRDALNNLAWLLLRQGRLEEAEVLARRAVHQNEVDPHLPLDTLARVLLARGRCEEAIATFQEGLRGIPDAQTEMRALMEEGHTRAQRECGLVTEAR